MRPIRPICITCGTQYEAAQASVCPVCDDERQWVRWEGQAWTDLAALAASHTMRIADDHGVLGLDVVPAFAIGQRALLVETPAGNLLWDCVALLNAEAIAAIRDRGGLAGIAISHPHYYTTMLDWSAAFGGVPIHLHAADRQWVMRPDTAIRFWDGETSAVGDGLTLVRCGGHFEGGTVLHWHGGAGGRGALLTGNIIQVVADREHVSFMYSYPNHVPLSAAAVGRIVRAVEPLGYDRVYGAFWDAVIGRDGKAAVARSADRYLRAISGP
jgi:hypothetical protein